MIYYYDISEKSCPFSVTYTIVAHTGCVDSTSSTAVTESDPESSGLLGEQSCKYHALSSFTKVVMRLCDVCSWTRRNCINIDCSSSNSRDSIIGHSSHYYFCKAEEG